MFRIRSLMLFALLMLVTCAVSAQSFRSTLFSDPSLIGHSPGFDGLWGTADDFSAPGLNPAGAVSAFGYDSPTDNTFGFWVGTLDSVTISATELELTNLALTGEASCTACGPFNFTNVPITATLAPGGPYITTLTSAGSATFNTFNGSSTVVVSSGIDETVQIDTIQFAGVDFGVILFNGQDPAVQFAGNQAAIDHFNFLLPLLPANWTSVQTDLEIIEIVDGFRAGLTGTQSITSYSVVVPLPAAWLLFGGALLLGWRSRRRH